MPRLDPRRAPPGPPRASIPRMDLLLILTTLLVVLGLTASLAGVDSSSWDAVDPAFPTR